MTPCQLYLLNPIRNLSSSSLSRRLMLWLKSNRATSFRRRPKAVAWRRIPEVLVNYKKTWSNISQTSSRRSMLSTRVVLSRQTSLASCLEIFYLTTSSILNSSTPTISQRNQRTWLTIQMKNLALGNSSQCQLIILDTGSRLLTLYTTHIQLLFPPLNTTLLIILMTSSLSQKVSQKQLSGTPSGTTTFRCVKSLELDPGSHSATLSIEKSIVSKTECFTCPSPNLPLLCTKPPPKTF